MVKVTIENLHSINKLLRKLINTQKTDINEYSHSQNCKLSEYLNQLIPSIQTALAEIEKVDDAARKSQDYLDKKYQKQYDELNKKELEVPELDMSLLDGFGFTIGEICLFYKLSKQYKPDVNWDKVEEAISHD